MAGTARAPRRRDRWALTLAVVLALALSCVAVETARSTESAPAHAADLSQFDAGNIISDQVFYDSSAMTAADVQSFLVSKGGAISSYRMSTASRAADSRCAAYQGAANELASTIIAKVAVACGINPRVLLVTLQKEQGLITAKSPTAGAYRIAMGYGCPDTAACDALYYGFANQVYSAAHQFKNYAAYPSRYPYHAGMTNYILWNPNTACGRSAVYLANQATTSLYNYTPYRPNAAALSAGYGYGDSCSSYGNRNFWNYFTDWFGSTQYSGPASILAAYTQAGGSTGELGAPVTGYNCGIRNGGCFQHFQGGSIYWSPASGAHAVPTTIRGEWSALGWENSILGYPTGDEVCTLTGGGCYQFFQGGIMYWQAAVGAHYSLVDAVRAKWGSLGYEHGALGYPTANPVCGLPDGGCYQEFQNGAAIYNSRTGGAHPLTGDLRVKFDAVKGLSGVLGYPTSDATCGLRDDGCTQRFQGGILLSTASTGVRVVSGPILDEYAKTGSQDGALGYPVTDVVCGYRDGGCLQKYQVGGAIYWSPASGAHFVTGDHYVKWATLLWERGILGYPTSDPSCGLPDSGCTQQFQGGMLISSHSSGVRFVRGVILSAYRKAGFQGGPLGYPISDVLCGYARGGCLQKYQVGGSIYFTPATGAHPVIGLIYTKWSGTGWELGPLGYPTSDIATVPGGFLQYFEHGSLRSYTATGTVDVTLR